jgi:hypothetical protein
MAIDRRLRAALWLGVLGGPVAFLLNLQANYMLVDLACESGARLALHAIALAAVVLTAGSGLLARRYWQTAGGAVESHDRTRFMAFLGMLTGGLFFLVMLAQWIPIFVVDPCQR